jgi:hypothetical protein
MHVSSIHQCPHFGDLIDGEVPRFRCSAKLSMFPVSDSQCVKHSVEPAEAVHVGGLLPPLQTCEGLGCNEVSDDGIHCWYKYIFSDSVVGTVKC